MKNIVQLLYIRNAGFTRKEIVEKLGITDGGRLSSNLNALIASDFIIKYVPFGYGKREEHYKLVDTYGRRNEIMSRELTLIEKMGAEFEERAVAVNEEAYELLCGMEEKLLKDSDTESSFENRYVLRTQVRMLAEEIVMQEVVNVFH